MRTSHRLPTVLVLCATLAGCGTTKWTDTRRSATEQLLISDAMDRAVSRLDFRALAGKTVYLDSSPLQNVIDSGYLVSSIKQHMLASGCVLRDKQTEADYVVEVRSGAVGTDHHELIYGVPGVDIPASVPVGGFGIPTSIPEIPFVTRTDQRAVAKIAVFAYNRRTGRPVWQSGIVPIESTAKAIWVFGAGPFQRGSIYEGTNFAGDKLDIPLIDLAQGHEETDPVSVADEAYFVEPQESLVQEAPDAGSSDVSKAPASGQNGAPAGAASKVVQTGHTKPHNADAAEGPPANPSQANPSSGKLPPHDAAPVSPPRPLPPTTSPIREFLRSALPWCGEAKADGYPPQPSFFDSPDPSVFKQ